MSADDDRRILASAAAALTTEVGRVSERLESSNKRITALTEGIKTLGQRSKKHSGWIFATAAGLALDVALTVIILMFYDQQAATTDRLEVSVQESCAFYSLVLGSYRPESRPPESRDEYERSFVRMRRSYDVLQCTEPIVPPPTSAPPR